MNKLQLQGTQNFLGIEIPIIVGGFGENQKVILAKTISEIHKTEVKYINELINSNKDEFEFGIDILDLKNSVDNIDLVLGDVYNKQSIANSKNIFLLSEQGYMTLVMLMRTDKAKEIRKKFRREYFTMREIINSNEQLKAKLLLDIYNGGDAGVVASKKLAELETKPLLERIEEDKPLVRFANTCLSSKDSISVGVLAKIVSDEGIKIGRNKLFNKLRDWNYICKNSTEPTQYAMERGYFEVIEGSKDTVYGVKLFTTTKVTPKGQLHIIDRLKREL